MLVGESKPFFWGGIFPIRLPRSTAFADLLFSSP